MNEGHVRPAERAEGEIDIDMDGVREALEGAGWRVTPQRLAVYAFLRSAEHHPTAEEVYHGVREAMPRISLATVYKALEALVACDKATKLTAGDGSARYDAFGDQHYHLRCLRSGSLRDLPTPYDPDLIRKLDPELTARLLREGFHVTGYRLELVGFYDGAPRRGPSDSDDA